MESGRPTRRLTAPWEPDDGGSDRRCAVGWKEVDVLRNDQKVKSRRPGQGLGMEMEVVRNDPLASSCGPAGRELRKKARL